MSEESLVGTLGDIYLATEDFFSNPEEIYNKKSAET